VSNNKTVDTRETFIVVVPSNIIFLLLSILIPDVTDITVSKIVTIWRRHHILIVFRYFGETKPENVRRKLL
jgi:hypothetical protein